MMDDNERLAEFTGSLEELFTTLGDSRLEALNEVQELQVMSRVLLQNEVARIDRKLGKDHPRAQSLRASLEENLDSISALGIELETSRISPPEVEENQTLVHGRVVDENGRGVPGLLVSVVDEAGRPLHFLGRSETDASGYYALTIDPDALQKASRAVESGVFVSVTTGKDKLLHRKFEPLEISEGERTLVEEVVLDRDDLVGEGRQLEYRRVVEYPETPGERPEPSDELDLEDIWGIGPKRAARLRQAGIADVQALSEADEGKLREVLGNLDVHEMKLEAAALLEQTKR
jgi:hypothetical protein